MFSNNKFKCCICGETVRAYGNNPFPVRVSGRCCDLCNYIYVIPARLLNLSGDSENNDRDPLRIAETNM